MGDFEMSLIINRPLEEVFAVLADLENDPKWRSEWATAETTSTGPLGVGTTVRLVASFLSRRIEAVYETSEYERNLMASWRTVSGPLPLTFSRGFEQVEGGTRVSFRYEMEVHGFMKLAGPLAKAMGKRALKGDIPTLKKLMEAPAP